MFPNQITYCLIWGKDYRATGDSNFRNSTSFVRSDRTGGAYQITEETLDFVNEKDDSWKARLTTWLIDRRVLGDEAPMITTKTVECINGRHPLPAEERADRLLQFIAKRTDTLGGIIKVASDNYYVGDRRADPRLAYACLAWSESTRWEEVYFLVRYLKDKEWIAADLTADGVYFQSQVTIAGHSRITEIAAQAPATDRPEQTQDDPESSRWPTRGEAGVENTQYEVALSFAGEQREYVERVARALRDRGVAVFYDDFEKVPLWGKDLIEELHEVFERKAALSVMFISKEYVDKAWPQHERRSILSRALQEKSEYVLPVRFDDTSVPGLSGSIKYEAADDYSPEKLAEMIAEKLDAMR